MNNRRDKASSFPCYLQVERAAGVSTLQLVFIPREGCYKPKDTYRRVSDSDKGVLVGSRTGFKTWWDPDPVLKAWLDPGLETWSDLDLFLKLGRIWIRSEQLVFRNLD